MILEQLALKQRIWDALTESSTPTSSTRRQMSRFGDSHERQSDPALDNDVR